MKLLGLIFLSLYQLNSNFSQSFSISGNFEIPGFATTDFEIVTMDLPATMDATFGIENICIDIQHTFDSDLTIWLISPQGTQVLLSEQNGGSGDNYSITCFDGNTNNPFISQGTPPFNGNYQPEEPLGTFNNGLEDPNGTWILRVNDAFAGDDGVLFNCTLNFGDTPALVPVAPNDECQSSIEIIVNENYNCNISLLATISGASSSPQIDNCTFGSDVFDDDVWFYFYATSSRHDVELSDIQGSTNDLVFQVYSGNCTDLNFISCFDNESFTLDDLIKDSQYFLRIASKEILSSENTTFKICVKEGIPDPPVNDECTSAIELSVCSAGSQNYSVGGATASPNNENCNGDGGFTNDIWFYFVATETEHQISVANISGTTKDLDFQVGFSNSGNPCNNLKTELCYFDPNQGSEVIISVPDLTVGKTYYLRIATFLSAPQNTSFDICFSAPQAPPANDECSNAILLPTELNACNSMSGGVLGATYSTQVEDCDFSGSFPFNDDIWYYFVATETGHTIDLFNISGTSSDLMFQVFEGSCSENSSIFCQDAPDDQLVLTNLTVGESYYLRIASFFEEIENINFNIRLQSCSQYVCDIIDNNPMSLRKMIECSPVGATLTFDNSLSGKVLEIGSPGILIIKDLFLDASALSNPVKLSNQDINNINPILDIQSNLNIKNIEFQGKSPESMIIQVSTGGNLRIN